MLPSIWGYSIAADALEDSGWMSANFSREKNLGTRFLPVGTVRL